MLFIGCIHCDESDLSLVGLGSRQMAKSVLFNRAKDIYDVGFEQRKLTIIQSLFFMSFWRVGALLEKDTRHWLGAAISLAQTEALHRSSHNVSSTLQRIRRRVWWSIFTRERQCAAALGLPNRVRDEDCDIDVLETSDFEGAFDDTLPAGRRSESIAYMVGMMQLSKTLGKIFHCGFLPSRTLTTQERLGIKEELLRWKDCLPAAMQQRADDFAFTSPPGFHANLLHLAFNNLFILLYRSDCQSILGQDGSNGQVALQAASRNSAIVENMIMDGNLRHSPIHVITNLFNTLCIHTLSLRNCQDSQRCIIEHRAKVCLLGLKELQETWEVNNWILQLFFKYLDRSTAACLQLGSNERREEENHADGARSERNAPIAGPDDSSPFEAQNIEAFLESDIPWTWSTQEASQFLFSQAAMDSGLGRMLKYGSIKDDPP